MESDDEIKMCKHAREPIAKTLGHLEEPPSFELLEVDNFRCFGPNWCALGAIPRGAGCEAEEADSVMA